MSDMISRQAAIDAIDEWIKAFRENGHKESAADACLIQDGIIQLPSVDAVEVAQPNLQPTCNQRQAAIEAIIAKLDAIDHVPPWVFDELTGAIGDLPSAQPDLDEWCTDCSEYDQERHCCPRWNRVIRQALKDAQL